MGGAQPSSAPLVQLLLVVHCGNASRRARTTACVDAIAGRTPPHRCRPAADRAEAEVGSSPVERLCLRVELERRCDGRMVGRVGELWGAYVDDVNVEKPVGEPTAHEDVVAV